MYSSRRAGRPLSDYEINALFQLQHGLTTKRVFIESLLAGKIRVIGQRPDGEFLYSA
jgi:hypothetical protein